MTVREYISQKLRAFDITEAHLLDVSLNGLNLDATYNQSMQTQVNKGIISILAELILAPMQTSINEQGFSMTWDTKKMGDYYLYLCKRYGVTPDADVTSMLGMDMITDKSSLW